jgi:hypothetical protein
MPFPLGKLADPVRVISTIHEYIVCGSNVLRKTERSRYVVFPMFLTLLRLPRHSLADLPFLHIRRSQRALHSCSVMPAWPPNVEPTGG